MKKLLFLLIFGSAITGCKSINTPSSQKSIELNGTIQKLGMSTFQYGTHLLAQEGKTYALKSSAVQLDDFVGKTVTVKGVNVAGYPIENGPELIEVKKIKLK